MKISLERFSPVTYDLCSVILNNIDWFRGADVHDLQDGIEWAMNATVELEEFTKDADKIIDEYPDYHGGKTLTD